MPELRDVLRSGDIQVIWTDTLRFVPWAQPALEDQDLVNGVNGFVRLRSPSIVTTTGQAGEALTAFSAVYADAGIIFNADNTDPATMDQVIGVTLTDAIIGAEIEVVTDGVINNPAWTWAEGPVFVDVAGAMTQVPPTPPAAGYLLKIGVPTTPTQLTIDFDRPITLVEETP